jgi:hypothetical protein
MWSGLPADVKEVVILISLGVPSYPEDADSMLQVRRWPKTRIFDGKTYTLEFSGSHSDVVKLGATDLAEIPAGWNYGASYVRHIENGKPPWRRGPSYYWRSDSTLEERSYVDSSGTRTWAYDSTGALYHFDFGRYDRKLHRSIGADEYFSRTGELIALIAGGKKYWRGQETNADEMFRRLREYWSYHL